MRSGMLITSLVLFTSCASTPWGDDSPEPVEGGLLTYIPASEKGAIEEARAQRAQVNEDLAVARRDLDQVESRVALAKDDQKALDKRLEEARDQVEHAEEYNTREDLEAAEERMATVQKASRLARTKTRYYQDLEELAELMVELEEKSLELADARVQLREAEAISTLDRPAAQQVDLAGYRELVRRLEDEVAMSQVEARAAKTRVELRRQFLDDRAKAVPASFRVNEPEPLDEILSLRLEDGDGWMRSSMQDHDGR